MMRPLFFALALAAFSTAACGDDDPTPPPPPDVCTPDTTAHGNLLNAPTTAVTVAKESRHPPGIFE